MDRLQSKKRFHKILYSPLAVIIVAAVLIVIVRATVNLGDSLDRATALADHSGARVRELGERQESLATAVAALNTSDGQDVHFRKLGFAKPGEQVVMWSYEEPLLEATSTTEVPWWKEFIMFFKYE